MKKIRITSGLAAAVEYLIMFLVVFISVGPLVWVVISSFKTNKEILSSSFSMPSSLNLDGYKIAMDMANIPMRFMNSVIVAGVSTLIGIFIFSMAAYVLARMEFRFKGLIFGLLVSTMLIPGNAIIQPIYTIIKALGIYDTRTSLVLVYTGFGLPLSLFLLRSSFLGIPRELEEAAYVEGATFFQTFIKIMLPVVKPALVSSGILMFMGSWNELLYAMLLITDEGKRTLPLTMKYFTSTFSFNYSAMFAALVLCVMPTVILYIFLQKYIMQSMVAGSAKG